MADERKKPDDRPRRRGPVMLSELVGKTIAPLTARRGFAAGDLIAAWPSIVGAPFTGCTRPDRIVWPRGAANEGKAAVLIVRIDGPKAVLFQHEAGQVVERVNAFLGYAAVGQVRIVQAPVGGSGASDRKERAPLAAAEEARLGATVAAVESEPLRAALQRLGRSVLGEERR